MRFEATSDDFTSIEKGSTTTHSSTASRPGTPARGPWCRCATPAAPTSGVSTSTGCSLLLDGFQDDPAWSRFVARQVTKGIPALEKLVGAKWPGGLERIREDASPSVYGV